VLASTLPLLLAGCGGGGGTPLTKEAYAAKADAICAKSSEQTKALGTPSDLPGLAKLADKTVGVLDKTIGDLEGLKPPASEKALADAWLAQARNLKGDLQEIGDKAKAGDLGGVQDVLPKAKDHNTRSNELATRLGMTVCNKD
jgi:hypothetical protein